MTNSRIQSPKQWIRISQGTVDKGPSTDTCQTEVWHSKLGQNDLNHFLNSVSLPSEVQAASCLRQCYQSSLTEQLRVKSAGRNPKSSTGTPSLSVSARYSDKSKRLCSRSSRPRTATTSCTTSAVFMKKNSRRHQLYSSFAPSAVSILSFDDEQTPSLVYRNNSTLPTISPSRKEPVGIGRVRKLQELLQGKDDADDDDIALISQCFGLGPDTSPCTTPEPRAATKRGKSATCSSSKIPTTNLQRPVSVPTEKTRKLLDKLQNEQVIMIPNGRGDSARTRKSASTDVSNRSTRSVYRPISAMSKCTSYCIETINPSDLKAYLRADSSLSEQDQVSTQVPVTPTPAGSINGHLTCIGKPFSLHDHQVKFHKEPIIPIALCVMRRLQQQQNERNTPSQ